MNNVEVTYTSTETEAFKTDLSTGAIDEAFIRDYLDLEVSDKIVDFTITNA